MDESHRLKKLPENYDLKLFNQLYKETAALRRKLAYEIDARKFGVDYFEVLSWFDVKFMHAFVRYYGNDKLKGYIINSLKTYKIRVVKNSYQNQYQVNNSVDLDEVFDLEDDSIEFNSDKPNLVELVKIYFKKRLSPLAFTLWEVELNLPPYILSRLSDSNKTKIPKCPDDLLIEYLGIECDNPYELIRVLRKEIKEMTLQARDYFKFKGISY